MSLLSITIVTTVTFEHRGRGGYRRLKFCLLVGIVQYITPTSHVTVLASYIRLISNLLYKPRSIAQESRDCVSLVYPPNILLHKPRVQSAHNSRDTALAA